MSKVYSDAFIEQALIKVYSRGKRVPACRRRAGVTACRGQVRHSYTD